MEMEGQLWQRLMPGLAPGMSGGQSEVGAAELQWPQGVMSWGRA